MLRASTFAESDRIRLDAGFLAIFRTTTWRYARCDRGGQEGLASFDEVRLTMQCTNTCGDRMLPRRIVHFLGPAARQQNAHYIFGGADNRLALIGKTIPMLCGLPMARYSRIIRVATQLASD